MKKKKGAFAEKRWNYIADVLRDEREIKLMSSKGRTCLRKTKTYFAETKMTEHQYIIDV